MSFQSFCYNCGKLTLHKGFTCLNCEENKNKQLFEEKLKEFNEKSLDDKLLLIFEKLFELENNKKMDKLLC